MAVEISKAVVRSCSRMILDEGTIAERIGQAFQRLRTLFEQITEITGYNRDAVYKEQVVAEQGMAININQTVRCFHDERRTLLFLRAMVRAIREKQQQNPGQTIEVCYAGCGPYAPFCTLVAPLFRPEEVQFTLLEINAVSLKLARELIDRLDLGGYVRAYQQVDAVTYQLAAAKRFHILFSETLDAALHRECFVPILLNLLPQLDSSIALIPQNVILRACLVNGTAFPNGNSDVRDRQAVYAEKEIGQVFNVQQALEPYRQGGKKPQVFPTRSFTVPNVFDYDYLVVYTEVQVYQDLWLTRGESLLTEPLLRDVSKIVKTPDLHFSYRLSPVVELQLD